MCLRAPEYVQQGDQLTGISALLGKVREGRRDHEPDTEKLLELYRNRAELKREYAELRTEYEQLENELERRDRVHAELQASLDRLERLLRDPCSASNVLVWYQLQAINVACERRLGEYAQELRKERETKQRSQLIAMWEEQRELEGSAIQSEIGAQRLRQQGLEEQLIVEQQHLAAMNTILRLFKRRSIQSELAQLSECIASAQADEHALLARLDEVQNNRPPPDMRGLNRATKRMINFLVLALAQELYLHLDSAGLAELANEASDTQPGVVDYGGNEACQRLLTQISGALSGLQKKAIGDDILSVRARLIARKALFRNDADAIPVPETVTKINPVEKARRDLQIEADLLGKNVWNLSRLMSR